MDKDRMDTPETDDTALDALFAGARAGGGGLPDGLRARMLADAYAHLPPPPVASAAGGRGRGWWADALASLGGWRAGMALGGAACAGLSMGYLGPDYLPTTFEVAGIYTDSEATDLSDPLEPYLSELDL